MSEKIEQKESPIILSEQTKSFLTMVQPQKAQASSKNLTTNLQDSLSISSYQKSNKTDQIPFITPIEQEQRKLWTVQEEKLLVELHNLKGNRWVQISLILNQLYLYNRRSDNSVKNHFHSKLRRGARKINCYLQNEQKESIKIIRNNFLAKIVQTSQGVTINNLDQKPQRAVLAYEIKNFILSASDYDENQFTFQNKECFKIIIKKTKQFQALFKAKPKFCKIDGGIRYKGKEIKTLIKENQIKQKLNNEKRQKFAQTIKQQTVFRIENAHQTQYLQENIYQEIPLYYRYGQQQTNFPFFNLPLMVYPTFTSISSPSSFFPIQDYPSQSTIGSFIPQNMIPEDDSRGSALNNF